MHLVDAFIRSNLVHLGTIFYQYVFSVSMKPMTLLASCSTSYIIHHHKYEYEYAVYASVW